jgi:hypothetical protein
MYPDPFYEERIWWSGSVPKTPGSGTLVRRDQYLWPVVLVISTSNCDPVSKHLNAPPFVSCFVSICLSYVFDVHICLIYGSSDLNFSFFFWYRYSWYTYHFTGEKGLFCVTFKKCWLKLIPYVLVFEKFT